MQLATKNPNKGSVTVSISFGKSRRAKEVTFTVSSTTSKKPTQAVDSKDLVINGKNQSKFFQGLAPTAQTQVANKAVASINSRRLPARLNSKRKKQRR